MKQIEQISTAPRVEKPSALKVWATRALAIAPLLAAEAGCAHNYPVPNHAYTDGICWDGVTPDQYPPARIPEMKMPERKETLVTSTGFLESYFEASNVRVPEFSFSEVKNDEDSDLFRDYGDFEDLYEDYCLEDSYNPINIKAPKTLETVTVTHKGQKLTVPIQRAICKLFVISSANKPSEAEGLHFSDTNNIAVRDTAWQITLYHEATHAYLDQKWQESEIDSYGKTKVSAGSVLTDKELEMAGLKACSPLSMDMANEMVAYAATEIKTTNYGNQYHYWTSSMAKARFALGLNIMDRITSVLKNGNQSITKNNFGEFDPYHLFNRVTEWIDEPWAQEAAQSAGEKSPWVVLTSAEKIAKKPWAKGIFEKAVKGNLLAVSTQAPFLIEILGSDFFVQELDQSPEKLAYIPNAIRRKHWPERKLSAEATKKLSLSVALANRELLASDAVLKLDGAYSYISDYGESADPKLLLSIAEKKPFLMMDPLISLPLMKKNCPPENWGSSALCQQIKASLIKVLSSEELMRDGHIDKIDIDNMLTYFLVHSKNSNLGDLLTTLVAKDRASAVQRLYTVKQKMMYEVHVNKNKPEEWAIKILEKYGVYTEDLRAEIKKMRSKAAK